MALNFSFYNGNGGENEVGASPITLASHSSGRSALPKPTPIILPKKKPLKCSTGIALGEYGGPSRTSKLHHYWGGKDPDLFASGDFIWNTSLMARMRQLVGDEPTTSS